MAAKKKTAKKPAAKKKRSRGRPSKYKAEFVKQAEQLAELGATDVQMAKFFGVAETTLNAWKSQHPAFFEALKKGKQRPDDAVERSLFERATGYTHPEEKIFCNNGQIIRAETLKHYPPDTVAAIFWLKNRRPDEWRDKREITGDPENPITVIAREWAKDLVENPE